MPFDLFLFTTDPQMARKAVAGGISGLVVDWEVAGKADRQRGAGLEENRDRPEDIRLLKATVEAPVLCRVNGFGPGLAREVDAAVEAGADLVFLPMVRSVVEVEGFLEALGARTRAGILVETRTAVERVADLARLPLDAVYIGLNHLALDRGTDLFEAVADGTVEAVRRHFSRCAFGFGGLTVMDRGFPVPSRLLALEMGRLGCDFTFLRRSFKSDIQGRDLADEIGRIRAIVLGPEVSGSRDLLVEEIRRCGLRLR